MYEFNLNYINEKQKQTVRRKIQEINMFKSRLKGKLIERTVPATYATGTEYIQIDLLRKDHVYNNVSIKKGKKTVSDKKSLQKERNSDLNKGYKLIEKNEKADHLLEGD